MAQQPREGADRKLEGIAGFDLEKAEIPGRLFRSRAQLLEIDLFAVEGERDDDAAPGGHVASQSLEHRLEGGPGVRRHQTRLPVDHHFHTLPNIDGPFRSVNLFAEE